MATQAKTVKFVRVMPATLASANAGVLFWMKLMYEFWGFCVNGSNNLRNPGGFASINPIRMAAGFESGSAVLLASGSDGSTVYGGSVFTAPSINWTSGSLINKAVVTWISGSTSTDDSVYRIVRVLNSSSVLVNTQTGGTPMSGSTYEPKFTTRSNINFRVVDIDAAQTLTGFAANNYMVYQFNGNGINPGQANSQVRFRFDTGGSTITRANLSLSASGSWNGSTFSDAGPEFVADTRTVANGGSVLSPAEWFNGSAGANQMTIWADQGGFTSQMYGSLIIPGSGQTNPSAFFHVEVPNRLYPASKDPNPMAALHVGKVGFVIGHSTALNNIPSGWVVHCPLDNAVVRNHHALVRNFSGIASKEHYGLPSSDGADRRNATTLFHDGLKDAFFNVQNKSYMISDIVLAHRLTTSSYSIGRCQLRLIGLCTRPWQDSTNLGNWITLTQGIVRPWDGACLPHSLTVLAN